MMDTSFRTQLLKNMMLIRKFEEKVSEMFLRGEIPGTIHLSTGQEAVPVGVVSNLIAGDYLIPTHRGHGHVLAKGMEPKDLFAELFARETGCCGGKGGSLHIGDYDKGILPANPVVCSSIPVATGVAFSFMYRKKNNVMISFFGDGAVNTGPFHEGINLAAIWNLPIVFVCENNQYAISTKFDTVVKVNQLVDRASAYGIPGIRVDGNDVEAVYEGAKQAIEYARSGNGPTFLECLTYRQGGHKRDDSAPYRSREEVEYWLSLDPILQFKNRLINNEVLTKESLLDLEKLVDQEIEQAVAQALNDPAPESKAAFCNVYA